MTSLKELFQIIEYRFGVTEEQIKSKSRLRYISQARGILSWYLIEHLKYDNEIVSRLLNVDRTSLYYTVTKYNKLKPNIKFFTKKTDVYIINEMLKENISDDLRDYLTDYLN